MGHSTTHAQLHDYFNNRQADLIRGHLAPEFMFEDLPQALTIKSHDEFIDYLGGWTSGMSDASVGSPQYLEGSDHSVALFHARGTNDGSLGGMPPSGRHIDVPFCEVLHFGSDGKVISGELYYDQVTLLSQLGIMAAPSGGETTRSPEATVRTIIDAFDRMDYDALDANFTEDAQGVDELSRSWVRGSDAMRAYFEGIQGVISNTSSRFSDLEERIMGDTAVVTCWLAQDYRFEGEPVHIEAPSTFVLRRDGADWKCCLVSAVPLPAEE